MRVVANYSLLFICNLLCTLDLKLLNMILQFEKKEFSCYCFHFSYVWCYQARYTFLGEYISHNTFMYFICLDKIHILGHCSVILRALFIKNTMVTHLYIIHFYKLLSFWSYHLIFNYIMQSSSPARITK